MGEQIVNTMIMAAPKQRNNDDGKKILKKGRSVKEIWWDEANRAARKDTHAGWTIRFSSARQKVDGSTQKMDIAIPSFGDRYPVAIARAVRVDPHRENTGSSVWADTVCQSGKNSSVFHIQTKKFRGRDMFDDGKGCQHTLLQNTRLR